MPYCPKCGASVPEGSAFCNMCGTPLMRSQSISPQSYPPVSDVGRKFANFGLLSAILSLFFMPEVFGSLAIVLGAYTWKMERSDSRPRGFRVLIFGIVSMIMGMYFTAYFTLGDLIPSTP